jgi:hypothetical protein
MIDGGLLQAGCVVCSAFHSRILEIVTPTRVKNCFVNCGFSIDHVSSNDDSAMKLSEDEEDDWHSLQPI